ncbi:MAG: CBS domain-containing protein [Syntrophaceae bacterium]|nr:CBS domain-containing protein [Syntrophaceae bacterium]
MSIGEICNRDVVVINKGENVFEAAKLMRQYHVGDVVVVETKSGKVVPVGILTDRDIVIELIAENVPLDNILVEDVMSTDLVTVRENYGVWESIKTMHAKGVRRIIVVNDAGGLEGILSLDDLLELLSVELSDLVKALTREQDREKEVRL